MKWHYKGGQFDLTERGVIMGILNVTPDSFSDGGLHENPERAVEVALQLIAEGAEIIDIGGESTRPGAAPVPIDEELRRTIPVVEALRAQWDGAISIDTSKPEVAREAIEVGANIVNDVTGLTDPEMVLTCRDGQVGVVCMHMQGTPLSMQDQPCYEDVVAEVRAFFLQRYEALTVAGIPPEYICLDPGIGFGKSLAHNLALINGIPRLEVENRPILMGLSRKSFIGKILEDADPALRDWPTVALTSHTRQLGARVHRVHQVKENTDALRMAEALLSAPA